MIVTFTPNPAVDKTLVVDALKPGAMHRARESHLDPGGKGINAARVAHRLGRPAVALTVIGGYVGRLLEHGLYEEGVACDSVCVTEETRLNVVLVDGATGAGTRVWDRGAAIPPEQVADVEALIERHLPTATVFVCAGTLPPGLPDDFYAGVLEAAAKAGARTILDSDGECFRRGLDGRPTVIKPNVREAETLLGRRLVADHDVIAAAVELLRRGPEAVVVSMGAAGSILATADGVVRAVPPKVERRSTVGSGDSLVAGLAIALFDRAELVEGLRLGTAAGAATAMSVGTQLGRREDIERLLAEVRIEQM